MTKREVNRVVRRIVKHLKTPEGKASLEQARRDAEASCAEIRRKMAVDPMVLFKRITI